MEPYQFQKEVIEEIEQFDGRCLVALDTGLGKTPIAWWWVQQRMPRTLPVIVVCPSSVKYQWQAEAQRVIGIDSVVLEGQTPLRGKPDPNVQCFIINYDILRFWKNWLKKVEASTVIIDEAQYIASSKAKRTRSVVSLCRDAMYVLGLSATPLLNRPVELWPTLNIINPSVWYHGLRFRMKFCGAKLTPWGWDFKGASNTRELHKQLTKSVMSRRKKSEVLQDLPKTSWHMITLPIRNPHEYAAATEDLIKWLGKKSKAKAERASKAKQMVEAGVLLRLAAKLKIKYVIDWVNNYLDDTNEKLVLFGIHKKMIAALSRQCKAESVIIDGSVTGKNRYKAVQKFCDDRSTRLLLGNIKAAGTGVDGLQKVCSTMAFVELPWQPGAVVQAAGRLDRIGQLNPVTVYYLVAHDTIEENLCRLLQKKQSIISDILDGGEGEDLSLFNELMKELKKKQ